jgi:thioredoxin-like negative regulator of GroEL
MRILVPLLLLAVIAPARAEDKPAAAASMPWGTSYPAALKKAEAEKRPILFDFYTGWCPHCTRMDKSTWLDAGLIKLATDSFVVAKINADVEKAPVSRYRLTGYPTVIIAEPGGDQVLKLEGYKDAAAISAALKAYLGAADSLRDAFAKLRTDKKDADGLLAVGAFYSSVGLHGQAAETFLKAAKGAVGEPLIRAATAAGAALVKAGKADEARKILAQGLAAAGPSAPADLLLAAGQAEAAAGKPEAARPFFDRVMTEHPGSPEAAAAAKALGTAPKAG